MLCMRGHVSAGFLCCDVLILQGKQNVFRHIDTRHKVNFVAFTCIIKICYLFEKFTLRTCDNMTKTIVFTLQEQDIM